MLHLINILRLRHFYQHQLIAYFHLIKKYLYQAKLNGLYVLMNFENLYMIMKKIIFIAAALLALVSCGQQQAEQPWR